jgi:excisionase family DNA binding protein
MELPENPQDIRLLTVKECASQARVHERTVRRWIKDRFFEITRVGKSGKSIRIYETSWNEYLRAGRERING